MSSINLFSATAYTSTEFSGAEWKIIYLRYSKRLNKLKTCFRWLLRGLFNNFKTPKAKERTKRLDTVSVKIVGTLFVVPLSQCWCTRFGQLTNCLAYVEGGHLGCPGVSTVASQPPDRILLSRLANSRNPTMSLHSIPSWRLFEPWWRLIPHNTRCNRRQPTRGEGRPSSMWGGWIAER